jgi:hypothetical protein
MFRPGRENGTPAEPENVDCDRRLANASTTTNGGHRYATTDAALIACGDLRTGGKIRVCLISVSRGWGSVHGDPRRTSRFIPLIRGKISFLLFADANPM